MCAAFVLPIPTAELGPYRVFLMCPRLAGIELVAGTCVLLQRSNGSSSTQLVLYRLCCDASHLVRQPANSTYPVAYGTHTFPPPPLP